MFEVDVKNVMEKGMRREGDQPGFGILIWYSIEHMFLGNVLVSGQSAYIFDRFNINPLLL